MAVADAAFMDRALELAARGVALTSPNPMVGAVLVRDGKIIGEGFHTYDGVRHAEVVALEQTANVNDLRKNSQALRKALQWTLRKTLRKTLQEALWVVPLGTTIRLEVLQGF